MYGSRLFAILPLLVCAAIAVFAFGWSYTFKDVPPMLIRGFQPGAFPRFVAVLIFALSMLGIWQILRDGAGDVRSVLPREYALTVLLIVVFGALVLIGDFLLALMVGCAGIAACWGERRPIVLIGLGIVAPVAVVLFFDMAFQVRFPRGFLIDLYYG